VAFWLIVLLYAVVILVIILVHEAGHFTVAKAFGIKVEEFFVGFGPRLWSFRRGETEYGIKALPFGGYVRIAGMNPFQEPSAEDLPRTFGARPIGQRALVILAGPITHFLMTILVLALYFMIVGSPIQRVRIQAVCRIDAVSAEACPSTGQPSPALAAGLRPGDEILSVDGHPIRTAEQLRSYTRAHVGSPVALRVERDGRPRTLRVTPELSTVGGQRVGRLGVILDSAMRRANPLVAVGRGAVQTWEMGRAVILRLGDVFGPTGLKRIYQVLTGARARTANDVGSVVAGGRLAVQAVRTQAWGALIYLFAGLNVFVGILNLLPLPPLDGGHLAVLAYERIRRRQPDLRKLVPVTALVLAFMVLFALSVTYLDIVKPLPNPFR
jgi:membrane-associated protease RseP (regulator of RpoE activity)